MLKTVLAAVLVAFLSFGCKGEKGDKGDAGPQGRDAGDILVYEGFVASNDFTRSIDTGFRDFFVSVYIGTPSDMSELPYFLPGEGTNTFFIVNSNSVRIFNALLAAASRYKIVVVRKSFGSSSMSDRLLNG